MSVTLHTLTLCIQQQYRKTLDFKSVIMKESFLHLDRPVCQIGRRLSLTLIKHF